MVLRVVALEAMRCDDESADSRVVGEIEGQLDRCFGTPLQAIENQLDGGWMWRAGGERFVDGSLEGFGAVIVEESDELVDGGSEATLSLCELYEELLGGGDEP